MTNYQLSKYFCFCLSYFHQMELNNKEKYNLIFSFDKDRKKSVLKYCSYVKTIILKMKKIIQLLYKKLFLKKIVLFQYRSKRNKSPIKS